MVNPSAGKNKAAHVSVCADIKPALACINELLKEEIANGSDKWDYSEWRAEVQAQREKFPMQVSCPNPC